MSYTEEDGIVWIDLRYYRVDKTMTLSFYGLDCAEEMDIAIFKNVSEKFAEATWDKLGGLGADYIVYDEHSRL